MFCPLSSRVDPCLVLAKKGSQFRASGHWGLQLVAWTLKSGRDCDFFSWVRKDSLDSGEPSLFLGSFEIVRGGETNTLAELESARLKGGAGCFTASLSGLGGHRAMAGAL